MVKFKITKMLIKCDNYICMYIYNENCYLQYNGAFINIYSILGQQNY